MNILKKVIPALIILVLLPLTVLHIILLFNADYSVRLETIGFFILAILYVTGVLLSLYYVFVHRPMYRLIDQITQRIEGNYQGKISYQKDDQFAVLIELFNRMIHDIRTSQKKSEKEMTVHVHEIEEENERSERQRKALLNLLEDIDEEKKASQKSLQEMTKFKLAVDNASDHIVITDADGVVLYGNRAVRKITGYNLDQVIGQKAGVLWGGKMDTAFYTQMWKQIKEKKKTFEGQLTNVRKNGQEYIAEVSISPLLGEDGEVEFFVGIERDVTHDVEVDRMKTEFISIVSHQMRTPLSAIKWFIEMLMSTDSGGLNKEQYEMADNINKSNERMIQLVNGLLNVLRIESGRMIIDPEPTQLKDLVDEIVGQLAQRIKKRKQVLTLEIEPRLPKINVDPKMIVQIYSNLLTNAVKYTPDGGTITVRLHKTDKYIVSEVSDTGYGIAKKDQDKIFGKFFRASNILLHDTEGNGLGLYLVKSIVELSGGSISFTSEENKGTTFRFTLPLSGSTKKEGEVGFAN